MNTIVNSPPDKREENRSHLDSATTLWRYSPEISAALIRWYLGPDHRAKLRIWRYLNNALNNPRLSVKYGGKGLITLDYRDWLQSSILRTGAYEPEVWDALCNDLTEDEVFWDVGAHIGTFTVLACGDARFKMIHAFEPEPRTYGVLSAHLQMNPGVPRAAHRIALSSSQEERELSSGPQLNTGLASFIADERSGKQRTVVHCNTADHLVYDGGFAAPTVMKVDVEGWELEVLRGATRLLRETPPKAIVVEGSADEPPRCGDGAVGELLSSYGYAIHHIPRPDGHREPRENFIARLKRDH